MVKLRCNFAVEGGAKKLPISLKRTVKRAISAALTEENMAYPCLVSVTFCDNEYIRELNRTHREKDSPTDVLSFPMCEPDELFPMAGERYLLLGDIVISLERAEEQAREIGNTFLREVAFLAIHSTLHLLGYDHERSHEDDEIQCEKQKKIIEKLKV